MCVCVCVCVCARARVCVCVWGGGWGGADSSCEPLQKASSLVISPGFFLFI